VFWNQVCACSKVRAQLWICLLEPVTRRSAPVVEAEPKDVEQVGALLRRTSIHERFMALSGPGSATATLMGINAGAKSRSSVAVAAAHA
jgi:hypothetical protein